MSSKVKVSMSNNKVVSLNVETTKDFTLKYGELDLSIKSNHRKIKPPVIELLKVIIELFDYFKLLIPIFFFLASLNCY